MLKTITKLLAIGSACLALASCNVATDEKPLVVRPLKVLDASAFADKDGELDPEVRFVVGRGPDYQPIGGDPAALFQRLEGSMADRRKIAWQIVEAMLAPQTLTVGAQTYDVPLWQTWYEGVSANPEVNNKIKLFFANVEACIANNCGKSRSEIAKETMAASTNTPAEKALFQSLSNENLSQRLNQHKSGHLAHGVGTGLTLFSPSFVEHVLANAGGIEDCITNTTGPTDPPPAPDRFTPCMPEFPASAVMVKTNWVSPDAPNTLKQPNLFDTDAAAMSGLFGNVGWTPSGAGQFDSTKMYSVVTRQGHRFGLQGIHFSTKDTREWIWITLWWSPQPNSDFGQDRPASIGAFNGGVWANYKMCVTTAFREADPEPWKSFETKQPLLAAALKANYEAVKADGRLQGAPITSWCSNPNVEADDNNHRTNCIGCHQYSAARSILTPGSQTDYSETLNWDGDAANAQSYPQFGRELARKTFLADFSWALSETTENIPKKIRDARRIAQVPKQ